MGRFRGPTGALLGAVLLGTIFFCLGGTFVVVSVEAYRDGQETESWPSTTGRVLSSAVEEDVETRRDSDGRLRTERTYRPVVRYEYAVGGRTYQGHRIKADDFGGGEDRAYATIDRYPAGAAVTVFYDPDDPAKAVLETGVDRSSVYLFGGIGAVFAVIGLAALAVAAVIFLRLNRGSL